MVHKLVLTEHLDTGLKCPSKQVICHEGWQDVKTLDHGIYGH